MMKRVNQGSSSDIKAGIFANLTVKTSSLDTSGKKVTPPKSTSQY